MPEINVMAEEEYEQQLTNIFLLLVSIERFVAFEFASNVRQFFVNTLDLGLFALACGMEILNEVLISSQRIHKQRNGISWILKLIAMKDFASE